MSFDQLIYTDTEKTKLQLTFILGIFFSAISTAIIFFISSDNLGENAKDELKKFLNFEAIVFIISVLLNFIPILGQLACFVLFIINLLICLKANNTIKLNGKVIYPITYQLF